MSRNTLILLLFLALAPPSFLFAGDDLNILDQVVAANAQAQTCLQRYLVTVETSRILEMMDNMTSGMPAEVAPPQAPIIFKFWQREGQGLIYASQTQLAPYVAKIVGQLSANLAIELNEIILPKSRAEQRRALTESASIKTSKVALADQRMQRLEIIFDQPTDLDEAFYVSGMRLPQKQVTSLRLDIDTRTETVSEMSIITSNGTNLAVEIRYLEVDGGHIPERFQITSPDGKTDDLFEVSFDKVGEFILPKSMVRTINRPNLQDKLEVFFKGYQINQPIPEDIRARLKEQ